MGDDDNPTPAERLPRSRDDFNYYDGPRHSVEGLKSSGGWALLAGVLVATIVLLAIQICQQ